MNKQARIIDDVAVDVVTGDPADFFHPDIAIQFEIVPNQVESGWRRSPDTGTWTAPELIPPTPASVEAPKVSPVEFKLLFTAAERVAIKASRASDPVIDDFFSIIEDPRLTHVNLGLQSTKDALTYLEAKGLITTERRQEILAGRVQ